jgi:hypothetical protein
MIAGDEHTEAEGYLYLDDGLTYAFEQGEFIRRKFSLKGGIVSFSKFDPLEDRAPEFLRDCVIVNITYYQVRPDGKVDLRHKHLLLVCV